MHFQVGVRAEAVGFQFFLTLIYREIVPKTSWSKRIARLYFLFYSSGEI